MYDANSIKVRTFAEACRTAPALYLGSIGQDGIFNGFLEILNNSCDEAIMGRGDLITVNYFPDKIRIEDRGRGAPRGSNQNCEEVLVELYTSAHSSGKFDNSNYKKVRGVYGLGASAICVCSKFFEVITKRDGFVWFLGFDNGIPRNKIANRGDPTESTGTIIEFSPNREIFHLEENEICFDYERIKNELELTSYFIPNVKFELINEETKEKQVFFSKNGLKDFAASRIKNPLHRNFIWGYKEFEDEVEIEVFAQWTSGHEQAYVFSNGALNVDGGTPITGAKSALTRTINSLTKEDFDSDLIRKGLVYIINIRHPKPIYQNQTKSRIQNTELKGYTQTVFSEAIKDFVLKNKNDFEKIIEVLRKEKKADAAADRARKQVLDNEKEQTKIQKTKILNVDKLCDARKLGEDSILLLCEGLSAGGSMKIGRDADKYGILMLRGKCKNLLNCTIEEGLQNEEVKLFQQALGIIYGKKSTSMRYGKIAITSDSDFDGSHIGLLIMAMAQVICPSILTENRLYWLKAPIYKVETKSKIYFYYTEEEFAKHPQGIITKYKGLGQMNDIDLKNSMFNDEWQRLEPINFNDEGVKLLIDLMGDNVERRKEFVCNYIDFNKFNIE